MLVGGCAVILCDECDCRADAEDVIIVASECFPAELCVRFRLPWGELFVDTCECCVECGGS